MTNDEKQSILNSINSMQRIGLFCEICRNATCICKIGEDSSIINALDDFNMNFLTPKEKAKELVDKYKFIYIQNYTSMHEVKECALIVVNEVLTYNTFWDKKIANRPEDTEEFWIEVKLEIEKL